MTSLSEQIESTRERIAKEQRRLVLGTERARRALSLAAREEAASWQLLVTTEQRRARQAVRASVELLRDRAGLERAFLRVADRTLLDVHAHVKARLSRIDRELTADATPPNLTNSAVAASPLETEGSPIESTEAKTEPGEKRVRARRPARNKSH